MSKVLEAIKSGNAKGLERLLNHKESLQIYIDEPCDYLESYPERLKIVDQKPEEDRIKSHND